MVKFWFVVVWIALGLYMLVSDYNLWFNPASLYTSLVSFWSLTETDSLLLITTGATADFDFETTSVSCGDVLLLLLFLYYENWIVPVVETVTLLSQLDFIGFKLLFGELCSPFLSLDLLIGDFSFMESSRWVKSSLLLLLIY